MKWNWGGMLVENELLDIFNCLHSLFSLGKGGKLTVHFLHSTSVHAFKSKFSTYMLRMRGNALLPQNCRILFYVFKMFISCFPDKVKELSSFFWCDQPGHLLLFFPPPLQLCWSSCTAYGLAGTVFLCGGWGGRRGEL